jgi:hypothetical protein
MRNMLPSLKSCKVSKQVTSYTSALTSVFLSAENDALRKAVNAQPTGVRSIPRPAKGVAGNGFNLRAAMELDDNYTLYCSVRVSLIFYYFYFIF